MSDINKDVIDELREAFIATWSIELLHAEFEGWFIVFSRPKHVSFGSVRLALHVKQFNDKRAWGSWMAHTAATLNHVETNGDALESWL